MKRYWHTRKFKAHQKKRAHKEACRRLIRVRRIKAQRRALQGVSQEERQQVRRFGDFTVHAPVNFCFLENTEAVIRFMNTIDAQYEKGKEVFVDLKAVIAIDYPAITALLSVMARFRDKKIRFNGSHPDDMAVKKKLIDSRFFHHLFNIHTAASIDDLKINNHIYTKADVNVDSQLGEQIMREASTTIWGEPRVCKGLQSVLIELMHNTNNHAATDASSKEKWRLSVNHDAGHKKVSFVFVDYGQGIFESLKVNWQSIIERVQKRIEYGTNTSILKGILDGAIKLTSTKQRNRGKGLRKIKTVLDKGQISNLRVISNDVSANVAGDAYTRLTNTFSGTLFYWELCYGNDNKVWNLS